MTIFDPKPLPLLVPRVDLRGVTAIGSTSITPGLYRSVYHAVGARYVSNTLFTSVFRCGSAFDAKFFIGRSSTFSGYVGSNGCTGIPSSSTSATQNGGFYFLNGSANWLTQRDSALSLTCSFGGTTYTVSENSLDSWFAGFEYQDRAAVMLNTSDAKMTYLRTSPWNYSFQNDGLYFTSGLTADAFKKLPIWSTPGNANTSAFVVGFAPSRPLQSAPTLLEEERVDQLVSIGGRSYRQSYARRRIYEAKLMLDGAASTNTASRQYDPMMLWGKFLAFADAGVTLWIDRTWLSGFWRPRTSIVCPNMPNEITGALLDASITTLAPRDGIPDAYEVTVRIADESGKLGYLNGEVPNR